MASRNLFSKFLALFATAYPIAGWCEESVLQQLPAEQIDKKCNLDFYAVNSADEIIAIGRPDYSIDVRWACDGKPTILVDNYEVEGGSPEIVAVFYRKSQDVVVLVKWSTNSQASYIQGDYYKIYIYRRTPGNLDKPFSRQNDVMKKLGEGWNGTKDGKPVPYPFKDASSIRKALSQLGY